MSLIGRPRKGFNVMAYNRQKLDRERRLAGPKFYVDHDGERFDFLNLQGAFEYFRGCAMDDTIQTDVRLIGSDGKTIVAVFDIDGVSVATTNEASQLNHPLRETLQAVRMEIVLAIAFLGRDQGTARASGTIEGLIMRLSLADAAAQAALDAAP